MKRRIAVTGLGVVTPVGNDVDSFWKNLTGGVSGIGPITRFDTTDFKAKVGAEVKNFDPADYGIDKPAAHKMDRFTIFAMAAAEQAMRMSGLEGHIDSEKLGVYVGSGIGGFATMVAEADKIRERGPSRVSPFFVPMMISNIAAGDIAIRFHAQGPCVPVVTACATSTNALGEAMYAIERGDVDAVIAGGAEATLEPLAVAGFTNMKALSTSEDPNAASLPFDKRRAGFVMGEGGAVLVLEEMEHARARGARIYAEMVGYGNTCDAHHITAPDPEGTQAARTIKIALARAAYQTGTDVLYINAHGTGTPLNDACETRAIKQALGEAEAYRAMVSSTKSMTGHMLGAAGAVEAIVCVLALDTGVIPPTINYREKDEACDLDVVPNEKRVGNPTIAISTTLGFGGHNGCVAFRKA